MKRWYPPGLKTSSRPWRTSAKIEAATPGIIAATIMLRFEARLLAERLGTYPSCAIASRTRVIVLGETAAGLRRVRDAVCGDTPARFATSLNVAVRVDRLFIGRAC